jgi:hypothetical protein
MDFEFRTQQDQVRRSVEDLFDFQGRMIGRGTYGKVFKARRKDGFESLTYYLNNQHGSLFVFSFFFSSFSQLNRSDPTDYALKQIDGNQR